MSKDAKDTSTGAPLYENLRKLINVVDELRDVGLQDYIELPRIAVVGTQSAGKSSLLESISGFDFLPRGDGVVTRRPLELRLVHVHTSDPDFQPYAVFTQEGKEKYTDFKQVYEKIQDMTDKACGIDKGIVDDPITLTVYSQTAPDLTLIDLPGITRIPIGKQPKNIEEITKNMCRKYARNERTIVLAVIPANQDMSTSDALQLAKQEDPHGQRTIGVITKIDLMDQGTNAKKMLMGEDIPLHYGYVGVKGRSQQDIKNNMTVKEALKMEKLFFQTNASYATLPPGLVGTESLTQRLTKVLFGHIKNTLPQIIKEIQEKAKECEERLANLGQPLPSTHREKTQMIYNMIKDFVENFKNVLGGKFDSKRNYKSQNQEIAGGAKIKVWYNELYNDMYGPNGDSPVSYITDDQIKKAMVYHQSESLPGFPSVDVFMFLLAPILKKLRDPALNLLNEVHIYLENLVTEILGKVFYRFPSIANDVIEVALNVMREEKEVARTLLENLISAEQTFIFTNDTGYIQKRSSIFPSMEKPQQQPQNPNQKPVIEKPIDPNQLFVNEIRTRLDHYFKIVCRNIKDSIPKIIGYFLVRNSQEKFQYELFNEINKNDRVLADLGEPSHISAERETLRRVLDTLTRAKKILTKDPDLAPSFQTSSLPKPTSKPNFGGQVVNSSSQGPMTGTLPQVVSGKSNSSLFTEPSPTSTQSSSQSQKQGPQTNNPFSGFGGFKEETKQDQPKQQMTQQQYQQQQQYMQQQQQQQQKQQQNTQSKQNFENATVAANVLVNGGQGASFDDMKKTAQFVNENKEDIKKASQFVSENKEDIKKAAQFANDHKEDIQKGAQFANEHKEEIKKAGQFLYDNKETVKKVGAGAVGLFGSVVSTVSSTQGSGSSTTTTKKTGLFG